MDSPLQDVRGIPPVGCGRAKRSPTIQVGLFTAGPANLVEILSRIHPEDRVLIAETFEQASLHKAGFHYAYRVENGLGGYKMVRSVGKFRDEEIVGITYEFVEQLRVVGFEDNGA